MTSYLIQCIFFSQHVLPHMPYTWIFGHCSLKSPVGKGVIPNQLCQTVSASKQIFQTGQLLSIWVKKNLVRSFSHLIQKKKKVTLLQCIFQGKQEMQLKIWHYTCISLVLLGKGLKPFNSSNYDCLTIMSLLSIKNRMKKCNETT